MRAECKDEERFLSAQADPLAGARGEQKVGLLRSESQWGEYRGTRRRGKKEGHDVSRPYEERKDGDVKSPLQETNGLRI